MQEEIIISKIRSGDPEGFTLLVAHFKKMVLNTCFRFLLNRQDAEDVSQEVFLEVYRSFEAFRQEARLSTWIYRIAVTKSLDELKKRKRKKRISAAGPLLQLEEIAAVTGSDTRADSQLIEKEDLRWLLESLDQLPDNQRVAFTLSRIEGFTHAEIAAILDTSQVAVDSLLYRARKKITTFLAERIKNQDNIARSD